jgi:hypothetical protein
MILGMAPFTREAAMAGDLDYSLARDGPVVLFHRLDVLDTATSWLAGAGYDVVTLHAGGWSSEDALHEDIASALNFPDYYGENLNALNDCLGDVAWYEYGTAEEATGLVLVVLRYDAFVGVAPAAAEALIDIFASQAHSGALIGHRMLCLVQSDDPGLRSEAIGCRPLVLNKREWLDSAFGT